MDCIWELRAIARKGWRPAHHAHVCVAAATKKKTLRRHKKKKKKKSPVSKWKLVRGIVTFNGPYILAEGTARERTLRTARRGLAWRPCSRCPA